MRGRGIEPKTSGSRANQKTKDICPARQIVPWLRLTEILCQLLPISSYLSLVLAALVVASPAGRHDRSVEHSGNTWTVGQAVRTSSGRVQGHAAPNASEVSEYLGIPYANPPVGELRFQPPTPFSNRAQTIHATSFVSGACLW